MPDQPISHWDAVLDLINAAKPNGCGCRCVDCFTAKHCCADPCRLRGGVVEGYSASEDVPFRGEVSGPDA
jgi:hypothetical protein